MCESRIEVHNNDMVLQDVLLWDVFEKHNCPDSAAATVGIPPFPSLMPT